LRVECKTFCNWVYASNDERSAEEKAEVKKLKKENARLKEEIEILKKASQYFAKHFKAIISSKHSLPVCSNLHNQNFYSQAPNQAWVGDINYIPICEGWL
jgi:hypothetical protein